MSDFGALIFWCVALLVLIALVWAKVIVWNNEDGEIDDRSVEEKDREKRNRMLLFEYEGILVDYGMTSRREYDFLLRHCGSNALLLDMCRESRERFTRLKESVKGKEADA